jgi:hypothetical protein
MGPPVRIANQGLGKLSPNTQRRPPVDATKAASQDSAEW